MKGLPGFRDFYPEPIPTADSWSMDLRRYIFDTWRGTAERYGFREYDGPPIEELGLYTKKSGDEIVGQLYNFNDKGDRGDTDHAEGRHIVGPAWQYFVKM